MVDNDLCFLGNWDAPHTGSDIGGVPPTNCGTILRAGGWREFYTQGGPWACWLTAVHRSVMNKVGPLSIPFVLMTDHQAPICAQAIEIDFIVAIGGLKGNGSTQINYAEGGNWQIVDASGKWVDTGINPGKLVPWVQYPMEISYDFGNKQFSVESLTLCGETYHVPQSMQNLDMQSTDWADSASVQVQQDLGAAGGAFSIFMKDLAIDWH